MGTSEFYCSRCGKKTRHDILFEKGEASDPNLEYWYHNCYRIVECRGCGNISFNLETVDESMVQYNRYDGMEEFVPEYHSYPVAEDSIRPMDLPWDFPSDIRGLYFETIEAINRQAYRLAAAGFRMIVEAICRENGVESENLENKIDELKEKGIITDADKNHLHSIRFMGNDSVHFSIAPKKEAIMLALEIIHGMFFNLYIIDDKVAGKLVEPIKSFNEFEKLLLEGISTFDVGHNDVLKNYLPRDKRLLKADIPMFEEQLKERIIEGTFTRLALCAPPAEGGRQQYRVLEVSEEG